LKTALNLHFAAAKPPYNPDPDTAYSQMVDSSAENQVGGKDPEIVLEKKTVKYVRQPSWVVEKGCGAC